MAGSVVIFGAGGHGRAIIELLRALPEWSIAGLVDGGAGAADQLGVPLLGGDSVLPGLRAQGVAATVVAIGANPARLRVAAMLQGLGFALPALVHPSAILAGSAQVGEGSVVMPRAVIGAAARVGPLCIVNTGAILDHDVVLGRGAHAGPGAVLAGGVRLGDGALVGAGAAVKPYTTIGADAVVGTGAAVVSDIVAGSTVGGVPAVPV